MIGCANIKDAPQLAFNGDTFRANTLRGWDEAKKTEEVRRLLQIFGTEIGRSLLGENIWVELATRNLESSKNYVFTDVRFPNEADKIKNLGGLIWRVERPSINAINNHSSEVALNGYHYDAIITNDSDMVALKNRVEELRAWGYG